MVLPIVDVVPDTIYTNSYVGGKIQHDAAGNPSGLLEDAAHSKLMELIPAPTRAENVAATRAALEALRKQGITTVLDAAAEIVDLESFSVVQRAGDLTVRAHFAPPIKPGSDWPVDRLDEWFALKVGVTRENAAAAGPAYRGRLSTDPGLNLPTAIRAMTADAAYELHAEQEIGTLEVGKLADFIVLDRNITQIPARDIADVKVLLTVVGGKTVYTGPP